MRVLVAPGLKMDAGGPVSAVARAVAGGDDEIVTLSERGVPSLRRPLSAAEVELIREALLGGFGGGPGGSGAGAGGPATAGPGGGRPATGDAGGEPRAVVGYVCGGRRISGPGAGDVPELGIASVVAVTDHAGLTWRSPLVGPNDKLLGPRFPRVDGVYVPEAVIQCMPAGGDVTVEPGVVAGVGDEAVLTEWERGVTDALGLSVVSSGLVAVAVIAAHLGIRLAAAVVLTG